MGGLEVLSTRRSLHRTACTVSIHPSARLSLFPEASSGPEHLEHPQLTMKE